MQTLTIKVVNARALKLIEDLEALNLIEVVKSAAKKGNKKKLSARLAGSISAEQAADLRRQLTQMRSEWERDI